ncbi:MAG: hydroxymyristoyl-ACP dehydratase [Pseudomonadota bacterium]
MTANLEQISWPLTPDWPVVDHAAVDGSDIQLRLSIAANCPWLEGHFPDRPVLPGVVQVRWAIQAAMLIWPQLGGVTKLGNVKFQRPILPPTAITLRLTFNPDKRLLKARFVDGEETYSSASITFA